ncbi:MAG TPA: hypothetical protein VKH44_03855 [Pirellulaceae bacterium]|nr:hypothetical protein [Pirellulaceae bacterium]
MRVRAILPGLLAMFGFGLLSCGVHMNKEAQQGGQAAAALPHEPASSAEILAASHIFVVEMVSQTATEWARPTEDALQQRRLVMKIRLVESLKGMLKAKHGEVVEVNVEQAREDKFTVSDFHGFWSHTELKTGTKYLVLAEGQSEDLAVLMQEPAIKAVLDGALASDVKAATAAEQQFGPSLTGNDAARRRDAALQMLALAKEQRAKLHGLFGRYLWARVGPVYRDALDALLPPALEIVQARDATLQLREALIYGLYDTFLSIAPMPPKSLELLRPLLGLLTQPEAAPLGDRLIQVPIYNLIFRPGKTPPSAASVLPDPAARTRILDALGTHKSAKAAEVRSWLAGEPQPVAR